MFFTGKKIQKLLLYGAGKMKNEIEISWNNSLDVLLLQVLTYF